MGHFSGDFGCAVSVCIVVGLVGLHFASLDFPAYCVLVAYMLCIHLPLHYLRVLPVTPVLGWLALFAFTCASWLARPLGMLRGSALCRRAAVSLIVAHTLANVGLLLK